MFIVPILCLCAGAFYGGRGGPDTRCEKKRLLGPASGLTYEVEDFPDAGFVVVRARDGSAGTFQRLPNPPPGTPRFAWRQGRGQAATLHLMCRDLGVLPNPPPPPQPAAAPKGV